MPIVAALAGSGAVISVDTFHARGRPRGDRRRRARRERHDRAPRPGDGRRASPRRGATVVSRTASPRRARPTRRRSTPTSSTRWSRSCASGWRSPRRARRGIRPHRRRSRATTSTSTRCTRSSSPGGCGEVTALGLPDARRALEQGLRRREPRPTTRAAASRGRSLPPCTASAGRPHRAGAQRARDGRRDAHDRGDRGLARARRTWSTTDERARRPRRSCSRRTPSPTARRLACA